MVFARLTESDLSLSMETKSLSSSLKNHGTLTKAPDGELNSEESQNHKLKASWNSNSRRYQEEDLMNGFSWPPRSYTCSFCKREFRSAQALGGHMNVHRRERARLRESPPREQEGQCTVLDFSLEPSPNPNFSSISAKLSSVSTRFFQGPRTLTSSNLTTLSSVSSSSPSPSEFMNWGSADGTLYNHLSLKFSDLKNFKTSKTFCGVGVLNGASDERGFKILHKSENTWNMEINLDSDSKELDLELRLGYS